ncbi:MAG: hypothetical protein R6W78_13185 [Bacteroidales bacterium]
MKNFQRLLILLLALITKISIGHAQIWPYSPMIRFGNTVYYPMDSLSADKLTGTSILIDKKITDRYFDILLISDSLGLSMNDTLNYFYQKDRTEPICYKEILFYKRRKLTNTDTKIIYLKFIDIDQNNIIAQAVIKKSHKDSKRKEKLEVFIPINELEGVFLGIGKNQRIFMTSLAGAACVAGFVIGL